MMKKYGNSVSHCIVSFTIVVNWLKTIHLQEFSLVLLSLQSFNLILWNFIFRLNKCSRTCWVLELIFRKFYYFVGEKYVSLLSEHYINYVLVSWLRVLCKTIKSSRNINPSARENFTNEQPHKSIKIIYWSL